VRAHRLAILATFIFCIIASAAQAASTEWKPYPFGAPGDYPPVVDACEAGSYIVGFRIRWGAWFDQIGPICGVLNSAGTSWSNPTVSVMRGGDGGGAPKDYTCRTNELIGSIEVAANDELKVYTLHVHCHDLTNPEKIRTIGAPHSSSYPHHQSQPCNPGERAIAINVHYGKHVNAIGLWCGPVKPAGLVVECAAYGLRMSTMVTEAVERTCAFLKGKGGWNNPRDYWQRQCEHDPRVVRFNEPALKQQLDECKAAPATSMKVKVLAGNKVYKQPSGEDTPQNTVCEVRPDDTADLIAKGADRGLDPHWFNVGNISGACGGQAGWIWDNGGELQVPL